MGKKSESKAHKSERLVREAINLILESGTFELSMRELAARAQVSLRTPYQVFGSKAALIREVLRVQYGTWRQVDKVLNKQDIIEYLFVRHAAMMRFISDNGSFYRALFQGSQFVKGPTVDVARERMQRIEAVCILASRRGILRPNLDPAYVAHVLVDIHAANMRLWANGLMTLDEVALRVGLGWGIFLSGAAEPENRDRLDARIAQYQAQLQGKAGRYSARKTM